MFKEASTQTPQEERGLTVWNNRALRMIISEILIQGNKKINGGNVISLKILLIQLTRLLKWIDKNIPETQCIRQNLVSQKAIELETEAAVNIINTLTTTNLKRVVTNRHCGETELEQIMEQTTQIVTRIYTIISLIFSEGVITDIMKRLILKASHNQLHWENELEELERLGIEGPPKAEDTLVNEIITFQRDKLIQGAALKDDDIKTRRYINKMGKELKRHLGSEMNECRIERGLKVAKRNSERYVYKLGKGKILDKPEMALEERKEETNQWLTKPGNRKNSDSDYSQGAAEMVMVDPVSLNRSVAKTSNNRTSLKIPTYR